MEAESAMLANQAALSGGLVSVLGGGFEYFPVPALPAVIQFYCAGVMRREPEEMDRNKTVRFTLTAPNGQERGSVEMTFDTLHAGTAEGVPPRTPFVCVFRSEIRELGVHTVTITGDIETTVELPFEVQQPHED